MIQYILDIGRAVLSLFVEMAPYLLLGLTVAGILSVIMKKSFVARHIGRPGFGSVVKASILGVPLPLCSCGVVPTAAYLKRAGASKPAVMSFLISTPQTGVDSIAATYGMLGPLFAVFRPIAALITGVAGGAISSLSTRRSSSAADGGERPEAPTTDDPDERAHSPRSLVSRFARYAYVEAIDDIAIHFLFGLAIGGVIAVLLPDRFFIGTQFGDGFLAMVIMVVVGIPMYVCSTSSIPIAVALIAKGLSPGAAYVFLVAGPATNAATLAILARVLGRRHTIVYVATLIVGSLLFGVGMDALTNAIGWTAPSVIAHGDHGAAPTLIDFGVAGALGVLIVASLVRRVRPFSDRQAVDSPAVQYKTMTVEGMTCHHCAANVENAVRSVDGIADAHVDRGTRSVTFEGTIADDTRERIATAIRDAGYEPLR
jgi:hypothetical protein